MCKKIFLKFSILITVVLFNLSYAKAQFEAGKSTTNIAVLKGSQIATGATLNLSYAPQAGESNRKILNLFSLKFRENTDSMLPFYFKIRVTLNITYAANNVSTPISTTRSLFIDYRSTLGNTYMPSVSLTLPESEIVNITIASTPQITCYNSNGSACVINPLDFVEVTNEMRETRYFNMSSTASDLTPNSVTADCTNASNRGGLNIDWQFPAAANNNYTHLEWAWVEDEMLGYYYTSGTTNIDYEKLFNNNSTRVDLINKPINKYDIPLLYDGVGKLYYRVRAAYRDNDETVRTGPWSSTYSCTYIGHEPNLNWQSSTSFAEEGKRKSVIQYFDGSLRGRQTVTKDNVNNNIVVAETMYDLQGRANVQILPTPTSISSKIEYFQNFNKFGSTASLYTEDPASYFDLTPAGVNRCGLGPKLDITVGNGRYYSPNNDWLGIDSSARYIPDAEGYAYTETRFMDDATQRVSSQGGVGINHQIGSGHETKYYYGKPSQTELDALFGTQVGDATHYSKNMVQDANGQLSVSYTDLHGRTIATALAGNANNSAALKPLIPSVDYPLLDSTQKVKNQLLTAQNNIVDGNKIEMVNTILVSNAGNHFFTYKLNPEILKLMNCNEQEICYDCKYDLEISIKSDNACDTAGAEIIRYNNLKAVAPSDSCTNSQGFVMGNNAIPVKQIDFVQHLNVGSYTIRKTLKLNDSIFEKRKQESLAQFLCTSQQIIYDSIFNALSTETGCGQTPAQQCDTCITRLGTFSAYRIEYINGLNGAAVDEQSIRALYIEDSIACVALCTGINSNNNTLASYRAQMLGDMIPYTGQYAEHTDSVNVAPGNIELQYNIFTTSFNGSTVGRPYFKKPMHEDGRNYYLNSNNEMDSTAHGNYGTPTEILNTVSNDNFTSLFNNEWAYSLLKYHPEYAKLNYAETTLKTSFNYLDAMQNCNSYDTAFLKGYLTPTANDPFYAPGLASTLQLDKMNNRITQGIMVDAMSGASLPNTPSIWKLANSSVLCATVPDIPEGQKMACIMNANSSSTGLSNSITSTEDKDKVWESFKTQYLSFRYEDVMNHINSQLGTGFITTSDMTALQTENKQLVFVNAQSIANQTGFGAIWSGMVNNNPPDTTAAIIYGNSFIVNPCDAQKALWKAKMKQCATIATLLETDPTLANAILDSIVNGLARVCKNGKDAQNPGGASNVNPNYIGTPRSFEEVVNAVLNANSINITSGYYCNPFTIDYPKPFGKNTPVAVNISNTLDSCACQQFDLIKTAATASGFTANNLTSLNQYLLSYYGDTLNTIVWNGLQNCSGLYIDTCNNNGGKTAYNIENEFKKFNEKNKTNDQNRLVCSNPVINSVYIDNNNILEVNHISDLTAINCYMNIYDATTGNYIYQNVTFDCNYTPYYTSGIDQCHEYYIQITSYDDDCGWQSSNWYNYLPSCTINCTTTINSVSVINNAININYTTPNTSYFCFIYFYDENYNYINYSYLNCSDSNFIPTSLDKCSTYNFLLYSYEPSCGYTSSQWYNYFGYCPAVPCFPVYSPILLPDFTTIPSFLNCGYQRPCITCDTLTAVTNRFKALYPSYNGVPYLGASTTPAQVEQNLLWARYINYVKGFSNSATDYIEAIRKCNLVTPASNTATTTAICGYLKPLNDPSDFLPKDSIPCRSVVIQSQYIAQMLYEQRKTTFLAKFDSLYKAKCLAAASIEDFYVNYTPLEYHYTLYYYDQAGNLVSTLPPAAVKPDYGTSYLNNVLTARANNTFYNNTNNNYNLVTNYRYNGLNQVVTQKTPDAGISEFWYDALGRLVVSQNAKQKPLNQYSYTQYDPLGRISQVGQKKHTVLMTQTLSQDTTALKVWITDLSNGGERREQITRTVYDVSYYEADNTLCPGILCQKNLRNRVSYTQIIPIEPAGGTNIYTGEHSAATYYSYDIHGNVDTLVQDLKEAFNHLINNRYKKMVYNYDLISGKVNMVSYQPGISDQFFHKYEYDAENRLIKVKTSNNNINYETDATYEYYRHGPLARTVLGENRVQGIDYAYAVQGWLKGVNANAITPTGTKPTAANTYDMGKDGLGNGVAKDAFSFSLNYFDKALEKDYKPIGGANPFVAVNYNSLPMGTTNIANTGNDLYNGNIKAMVVNLPKIGVNNTLLYAYQYDQLNRITAMNAYTGFDNATNNFTNIAITDQYQERVTYDPNGNIKSYTRNGNSARIAMDNMNYSYKPNTNQLDKVEDLASDASTAAYPNYNDIKTGQASNNYEYDKIGNLIKDASEGITNIKWTVYGKIEEITKSSGAIINYSYDASGNRIAKIVRANATASIYKTIYVRDASGNVMSVYSSSSAFGNNSTNRTEVPIYGSSRIGSFRIASSANTLQTINLAYYGASISRGIKIYELSNHLGNVLATITDRKYQIASTTNPNLVAYYEPDFRSSTDYYPFGMAMPGRSFNADAYRYGFNGKEKDSDMNGNVYDYGFRIYNPQIAKFLSVDPLMSLYPFFTPYQFASNNPVAAIDLDGLESVSTTSPPSGRMGNTHKGDKWKVESKTDASRYLPTISGDAKALLLITDAKQVQYWVVKIESHAGFIYGHEITRKEYFYFNREPSSKSNAYEGGNWEAFDPQDQIDAVNNVKFANNATNLMTGLAFAGAGGFAAAGYAATSSGAAFFSSIYSASKIERAASAGSDVLMQYVANAPKIDEKTGKANGFGWNNIKKINLASTTLATFLPGSNGLAGFGASGLETNLGSGYVGLGNGKSVKDFVVEGSINTLGNYLGNGSTNLLTGKKWSGNGFLSTNYFKYTPAGATFVTGVVTNGVANGAQTIVDLNKPKNP